MSESRVNCKFELSRLQDLRTAVQELGLNISTETDVSWLTRELFIAGRKISNSMAIQPMEGCDGTPEGAPEDLTFRRYRMVAAGGAGLLWFEACAVTCDGRANPRQLWLHEGTKSDFARLLVESRRAAAESMGAEHRPFTVLQLTHSGRYSRPVDSPHPIIAFHDPLLDTDRGISAEYPVITDDELNALEEA